MAASPALSQQKVTDTCAGQPTFTGSDSGDQTGLAFPTGITEDTFEMDGGGCGDIFGPDSVYCFIPENQCNPQFTITPAPAELGQLNVVRYSGTESCQERVLKDCVASAVSQSAGAAASTTASVAAGELVCVYLSTAADPSSSATFATLDMQTCGALPVKIQRFTVE